MIKKIFIITFLWDQNVTHHTLDYDEFTILMKNKEYNIINFKEREMQKYYATFAISENNNLDDPSLKKIFLI